MKLDTRRLTGALFLVLTMAAGACSAGSRQDSTTIAPPTTTTGSTSTAPATTGSTSTAPATPTTSTSSPSAGCASPAGAAASGTVEVDGQTRSYLLALPADLSAPAPVILDLHGLGESGAEQVSYSGLSGQGPAAGMIVATPNSDNGANSWTLPVLGKKDSDFMAALLDQLEATRCVDRSRETAAGISNGAGLSDGLICALDGRLAAIFPVSGVNILRPCATAKPTTIIAFHGTADPIVPYAGGPVTLPAGSPLAATLPKVALPTVEATAAGWAQNFGCRAPVDTSPAADIRLRTFSGCGSNATVELYTVNGGGHTWPGATLGATRTRVLGATTHSISATQIIVAAVGTLTTRR